MLKRSRRMVPEPFRDGHELADPSAKRGTVRVLSLWHLTGLAGLP